MNKRVEEKNLYLFDYIHYIGINGIIKVLRVCDSVCTCK
ncbi:hypothetical protein Closa_2304 [[Clostridium] saccharolyticum WM1]|uniref:Uncharacterized protein n=1 Tax=Lacrimispora saccharolytica (strain ATCC 35040 / DSM 2544 / NRCC 2533 / WM1) TaxID=610130 RepID=D9R3D0_LACSW|nr:hypothetical protein Closa_2304 [[Clostridium] saccharolyticum WM1]